MIRASIPRSRRNPAKEESESEELAKAPLLEVPKNSTSRLSETNFDRSSQLIRKEVTLGALPPLEHEYSNRTFSTRLIGNGDSAPSLGDVDHEGTLSGDGEEEVVLEIVRLGDGTDENDNNGERDVRFSTSSQTVRFSNTRKKEERIIRGELTWFQRCRQTCGTAVNNTAVQHTIIALICLNALMMGIGTLDFVEDDEKVRQGFERADLVFLIIFTIELGMQVIYHGVNLFYDGWLVFDFLVIVLSWSFASFQVVRAFRIFRTLRLISHLESLRKIIAALGAVGPSLGAILFLLFLVLYIFAVLCTELFYETELDDNYFTRLDLSIFTLLEMMTLEWADIARQVMSHHSWAWVVFSPFLVITSFILFSLVVAVVCDAVTQTEQAAGESATGEDPQATRQRVAELRNQVETLTKSQALVVKALREAVQELETLRGEDKEVSTNPVE